VPEIPFSKKKFIQDVKDVYNRLGRCQIAVSEGISDEKGNPIFQSGVKDAHGNVQLSGSGGLGDMLIELIKQNIPGKLRARADTFGYLQRCFPGIVSEADAEEARRVGEFAVKSAVESGLKDGSVAIKAAGLFITPLHSVAKNTRGMPRDYMNKEGNNITEKFIAYAKPLAGKLPEIGKLKI
jgi:6-phosphofructokinase 1